ncbi:hypothetical protein [Flavobacterium sp.]|jgi:hypothetical protein|uniref:hypothetical protein n=1 Tax=Flavobacterium sp. TaxID=239 RepID=UPI0037BF9503
MKKLFFLFILLTLISCNSYNSKWEEIKGSGISENETLNNVIFFQDSLKGIIGGYKLIENVKSKNIDKLDIIPILYFTQDGGKNWKLITIAGGKDGVDNVKLENDTIISQIDSIIYKSKDLGLTWNLLDKSNYKKNSEKYFPNSNQYKISNQKFKFKNKNYKIKEKYQNENAQIIVCYGEKSMTDYYFISKDNGKKWRYLLDEFGSNKKKFLLKDEYLFAYDTQNGLQKLKLE